MNDYRAFSRKRLLRTVAPVALVMVAVFGSAAYAQNAPAAAPAASDKSNTVGEVVVTAQFREQSLQNTPIAITAVNAKMLEQRGQTDISQVAANAPNVTLTPQPQNGGAGLIAYIRGVGQTDFDYALEPGVGIYVDDVYIPTLSSSLLDLMDLDRVEILRGPQGTLAGKNSIGGAIKLYSAKPRGDNSGYLETTYGSFNRLDVRGMADIKINDQLSLRISGVTKSRDGYVDVLDYGYTHPNDNVAANQNRGAKTVDGTEGGQEVSAGRIALRWTPTEKLEVNVSGDYDRERDEPQPTVLLAAGLPQSATHPQFIPSMSPGDANAFPAVGAGPGQPPWLVGKNGQAVPFDCRFVPAGPYSCDTLSSSVYNGDRRYISYANFQDGTAPTSQAPYKPYSALQNQDLNSWGVQGNIKYDITDHLQAYYIGSYRAYVSKWGQDQDASPVPLAQLDNTERFHAWSQELRFNGDFGDHWLEYTVGGFYMNQYGDYTARVDLNYAGIDFLHGPDTTPSISKALYADVSIHPTSRWTISGGLRGSWDEKIYTYFRRDPDGSIPPVCAFFLGAPTAGPTGIGNAPNCLLNGLYNLEGKYSGSRLDYRAVTDYRFSDQVLAYASISTGYMGGGINPRPFYGPATGPCGPYQYDAQGHVIPSPPCNQVTSFNPETLTTFEGGLKTDWFDHRMRLNGAVFYNDFNNIIFALSACPSSPCLAPTNVGKAKVDGFELETTIRPVPGALIDGSLSYIHVMYNKASVAPAGLTGNETFPYTPDWTYSFGAQYDFDMGWGILTPRIEGNYRSAIFNATNNSSWSRQPGLFLANARLTYASPNGGWRIWVEAQNVFDKYYFLSLSDITQSLGAQTGVPGLPRTFSVTLKKSW